MSNQQDVKYGEPPVPVRSLRQRRARVLAVLAAGTLLVVVGGLIGSRFMVTPQQRDALAAPPPPSEITAPLESRVVADLIVTRGDVASSQSQDVLPGRTVAGAIRVVLTKLPAKVGTSVAAGKVAVELSGRPVIVLHGSFPAYRDLAQNAEGADVRQLQQALRQVGLSAGDDPRGTFGKGTAAAVRALYRRAGYEPQAELPASEVLFSATVPVTIESIAGGVGSESEKAKLVVSTGPLLVRVAANDQLNSLAAPGTPVELAAEVLGETATGRVGESSGTSLTVVPDRPLPLDWAGQDVRVTIRNAATKAKVLAAPVTAIRAAGDGRTQVLVIDTAAGATSRRAVEVRVGVTGGGYAEVTPVNGGQLRVGDRLLVGP